MFFWRHKMLSLLIILGFVYWYCNPAKGFGLVRPEVIVFNRIPVAFMDFFVDTTGKSSLIGNLNEPGVFNSWLSGGSSMAAPLGGKGFHLLVGTGFGPRPSFLLPDSCAKDLKNNGVVVEQAPTPRAAELYNTARKQARRVAMIVRMKQ